MHHIFDIKLSAWMVWNGVLKAWASMYVFFVIHIFHWSKNYTRTVDTTGPLKLMRSRANWVYWVRYNSAWSQNRKRSSAAQRQERYNENQLQGRLYFVVSRFTVYLLWSCTLPWAQALYWFCLRSHLRIGHSPCDLSSTQLVSTELVSASGSCSVHRRSSRQSLSCFVSRSTMRFSMASSRSSALLGSRTFFLMGFDRMLCDDGFGWDRRSEPPVSCTACTRVLVLGCAWVLFVRVRDGPRDQCRRSLWTCSYVFASLRILTRTVWRHR